MSLDPEHVEWCRQHFAHLKEGGVWAVPRSLTIFVKREGKLVWMAAPDSAPPIRLLQEAEFEAVREHFGAAGIDVVREDA